jgi:hypothetical protein
MSDQDEPKEPKKKRGPRALEGRVKRPLRYHQSLIDRGMEGITHRLNRATGDEQNIIAAAGPELNGSMKEIIAQMDSAEQIGPPKSTPFFDPSYERKAKQLELLKKLQLRELAEIGKLDFWTFLNEILYPDAQQHYTQKFHGPICEELQNLGPGENLLICLPREGRKTMLGLAYIVWCIVKDPNIRIKIVTRDQDRARLLCGMVRDVFLYEKKSKYPMFHEVYPDFTIKSRKELSQVLLFTHPLRTANLIDPTIYGTYTGSTGAGGRCDKMFIDDGWDAKTLGNPTQGAKVFQQFLDLLPLVEASGIGLYKNIIVNTTPWKHFDPTAKILGFDRQGVSEEALRASPTFKVIIRHALETSEPCDKCPEGVMPHGKPDFKEGKSVLEPIFSRADYEKRLETYRIDPALGEPSFFLQYMTVYTNPDNTRFKDEWFIVHTKTGWTAPKRRVICLDDASKDFQQPGQGDYSVAQFGEWDDDGRLLLVHGMASNRWTRKEFIGQVVGWCQKSDWWPQQIVKEKVTTDDFLTEICKEFGRIGHPAAPFPVPRRGMGAKPDFIAGTLQVPVEQGRFLVGAAYPMELFRQLKYQLLNLGSSAHDDIADAATLFFVDGVRVDSRRKDVPQTGSGYVLPTLQLYNPRSPRSDRQQRAARDQLRIDPPSPDTAMLSRLANDPKMARALQGMGWAPGMVRWSQGSSDKPK